MAAACRSCSSPGSAQAGCRGGSRSTRCRVITGGEPRQPRCRRQRACDRPVFDWRSGRRRRARHSGARSRTDVRRGLVDGHLHLAGADGPASGTRQETDSGGRFGGWSDPNARDAGDRRVAAAQRGGGGRSESSADLSAARRARLHASPSRRSRSHRVVAESSSRCR